MTAFLTDTIKKRFCYFWQDFCWLRKMNGIIASVHKNFGLKNYQKVAHKKHLNYIFGDNDERFVLDEMT